MADDKPTGGDEAAVAERIEKLEAMLRQNDDLRRQTRVWSLVGVLVILALLGVFVLRIVNFVNDVYYTQVVENPQRFVAAFVKRADVEPTLRREAETAIRQLQDEVLRKFAKTFYDDLKAAMPEIEKEVLAMGGRLEEHFKTHVEQRLNDALIESLEACAQEIVKAFPELTEKEVEKHLLSGAAKELFLEQLDEALEVRYAKVDASLQGLKDAVKMVRNSKGSEALAGMNQGEAAERLLDALVDVLVYELKPELGKQAAE
jgi:hypothetical protein